MILTSARIQQELVETESEPINEFSYKMDKMEGSECLTKCGDVQSREGDKGGLVLSAHMSMISMTV
jgi:hypothetical protein